MKVTLNLASRRYLNRRAINQLGILFIVLLAVVFMVQVNGYLQGRSQLSSYEKSLTELELEYQELLGETPRSLSPQEVDAQKVKFQQAETLLQRDAFRWTALFDKMEKRMPSGVTITSFNPDYKARSLKLAGQARGLSDLQRFLRNLHKEPFEQIFLQSQGEVTVVDAQGVEQSALSFAVTLEGVF